MIEYEARQPELFRYRNHALLVGAGGLLLAALGWLIEGVRPNGDTGEFYRAYLYAWFFWTGVSVGSLSIVLMHHLTGGDWGLLVRRLGEAAALVLPVMIVLFIPVAIGVRHLFPWADPKQVADDAILKMRSPVFNVPFWLVRSLAYLLVWWGLAVLVRRMSVAHDASRDRRILSRLRRVSSGGLVLIFVIGTLAAVDWVMSREPHWYSSVLGFIVVVGQALSGLAFLLCVLRALSADPPFAAAARPGMFNDLGNMLLMFVILWAYVSFSQVLVTWMGNTQEDVVWYVQRLSRGWRYVSVALVALHFFVPFLLLLPRENKRKIEVLGTLAAGLLVLRLVDVAYLIVPSGPSDHGFGASWIAFVTPLGIGGIWFAAFLWFLGGQPLMPTGEVVSAPEAHGPGHAPGRAGESHGEPRPTGAVGPA